MTVVAQPEPFAGGATKLQDSNLLRADEVPLTPGKDREESSDGHVLVAGLAGVTPDEPAE